ncbi:hypothetical protein HYALB_00013805 [Hymenoscyphus albidus]|uniref:2EXR domain-containing protein n=1 Tax=Hymenoscyphus albidus TaxID=595503 RepID=A0A9N9QBJ8_9HELO|nr:hypothetical protein HYALB_00013805 [Hymenoscyphus albidus]
MSSPAMSTSTSTSPALSFEPFPRLPAEIRDAIWKYAAESAVFKTKHSPILGAIWICPNVDLTRPARALLISPRDFKMAYCARHYDTNEEDDSDDTSSTQSLTTSFDPGHPPYRWLLGGDDSDIHNCLPGEQEETAFEEYFSCSLRRHDAYDAYKEELESFLSLLHTCREARRSTMEGYNLLGCPSQYALDCRDWNPQDVLFFPLDTGLYSEFRITMLFRWMIRLGAAAPHFAATVEHPALPYESLIFSQILEIISPEDNFAVLERYPDILPEELLERFLANFPNLQTVMVVKDTVGVTERPRGSFVLYTPYDVRIRGFSYLGKRPIEIEQEIAELLQKAAIRFVLPRKVPVQFCVLGCEY